MSKEYKINFNDYSFPTEEGTYKGKLDFKMYGKKHNMLAYITLENGDKIIGAAYKDTDYLGIKEIEVDSAVEVVFKKSNSGMNRLSEINLI